MRVYFAADNQAEEKKQKIFARIIDILSRAGVLVCSSLNDDNLAGFSSQDLEKIEQAGEVLLEKMDGLIIEGSRPLPEAGYLFALALAHRQPILYLSEKGRPINKNLQQLKADKNTGGLIRLENYNEDNLENIILAFLQSLESGAGREIPTIKFTLRITPRIERYLHWKTHNTKITKADFLRTQVEKMIDSDEGYRKSVGKRK
jgi:hypothetical protein